MKVARRWLLDSRAQVLAAAAAAAVALLPVVPSWAESESAILRRVAAGEIVVEVEAVPQTAAGRVVALLDIPASQQRVWQIMLDCMRSMKIVEGLKSCRVTAADPGGRWDVREHLVQWAWPLPLVKSVFRSDYVEFDQIAFRRVAGDLRALDGAWRLSSISAGKGTRLRYEAIVDPGVPLPGFLVRGAIEAEFRKTLAALRRETTGHDRP